MFLLKILKCLESFFIDIDLYGHKVDLYIHNKPLVKSRLGALISSFVLVSCLINVIGGFSDWINGSNLQIISSAQSFNVLDLLATNSSYVYEFDHTNFYFNFVITAQVNGGPVLTYQELESYFIQKIAYIDSSGNSFNLEFEPCFNRDKKQFFFQDFNPNDNSTSAASVCIKEQTKLKMGLFANTTINKVNTPTIVYEIHKCQNTTENNNSCVSDEEIEKMLGFLAVQVTHPKTIFDFKNYVNPRKRTFSYSLYNLDISATKLYSSLLNPIYLYTDKGILNDDYILDSIDFNQQELQVQSIMRSEKSSVLFSYALSIDLEQQIYYRKNLKLTDLISNFGGTINIFFIAGQFICSSFNLLLLKHKLINISFENLERNSKM